VLVVLFSGCATTYKPACRHEALMAAMVVGEKTDVVIAFGKSKTGNHVQAKALIGDKWEWLSVDRFGVYVSGKDSFEVIKYYTPKQYLERFSLKYGVF